VRALVIACRDPRTPWYVKAIVGLVVAYALSPIDLIPDFIPVLGYMDDLVLVPLGVLLAVKLIPREVIEQARAEAELAGDQPRSWLGLALIAGVWLVVVAAIGLAVFRRLA
jgi:uncharacterized membrane protein YkvA (DUF1232 family)